MLDYTKMAIRQTISDLKKTDYIRNVATQIIYIIYLIYTLIAQTGYLAVNIILLTISLAYFIFFLAITSCGKTLEGKAIKKITTKVYVWCKRLIKLFTLGLTVYGIYTTVEHVHPVSVILAALMIVGWILQIVFEVLIKILTNRVNFILEGLEADLDNMLKPVRTVGNFFKKVTGKEVSPEKEPTKNQLKLKAKVEAFREEKRQQKEAEKLRRKEEHSAEKAQKRETRASIRLENQLFKEAERQKHNAEKTGQNDEIVYNEPLSLPLPESETAEEESAFALTVPSSKSSPSQKHSFFSRFSRKKERADQIPDPSDISEKEAFEEVLPQKNEVSQNPDEENIKPRRFRFRKK